VPCARTVILSREAPELFPDLTPDREMDWTVSELEHEREIFLSEDIARRKIQRSFGEKIDIYERDAVNNICPGSDIAD